MGQAQPLGHHGTQPGKAAGVCCSMPAPDQKSQNVLLQNPCCRILGKSEADVAQRFQDGAQVIGSSFALTVVRDEILVTEKNKDRTHSTKKRSKYCIVCKTP